MLKKRCQARPSRQNTDRSRRRTSSVLDFLIFSMCASLVFAVRPCHGSFPYKPEPRSNGGAPTGKNTRRRGGWVEKMVQGRR